MPAALTAADHQIILTASSKHQTRAAAAASLGMSVSAYKDRLEKARAFAGVPRGSQKSSDTPVDAFRQSGDTATVDRKLHAPVRNEKELARDCQIDLDQWRIREWTCTRWEMGAVVDGRVLTQPLYHVKAWLVANHPVRNAIARVAELKADLKAQAVPRVPPKVRRTHGEHMLEVMIPDLHLGKLAWGAETGHENYDSRIAQRLFREAVDTLIDRTSHFRFAKVLFPVGNDLFHSDTKRGTTTAGTPLDNDGRFAKMFTTGRKMIVDAIEQLRTVAGEVEVVMVPGNHDNAANFCLGDALECWYHQTPDVTIRNAPTHYKATTFGDNLILFLHGNLGQIKDYPLFLATELPAEWGRASHREIHTGDKHTMQVQEKMGIRTRIFSALCPPDAWHAENLFVNNERQADALVWHPHEGQIASASYKATV